MKGLWVRLLLVVTVGVVFFATSLHADDVSITRSPSGLTATEGGTLTLTFTVTNTSTTLVTTAGSGASAGSQFVSGDSTDYAIISGLSTGTCGSMITLAPGGSCTFSASWTAVPGDSIPPASETDADTAITLANGLFQYCVFSQGMCVGPDGTPLSVFNARNHFLITATDVTPTSTPEPASLLLVGVGLAGLVGLKRTRKE